MSRQLPFTPRDASWAEWSTTDTKLCKVEVEVLTGLYIIYRRRRGWSAVALVLTEADIGNNG